MLDTFYVIRTAFTKHAGYLVGCYSVLLSRRIHQKDRTWSLVHNMMVLNIHQKQKTKMLARIMMMPVVMWNVCLRCCLAAVMCIRTVGTRRRPRAMDRWEKVVWFTSPTRTDDFHLLNSFSFQLSVRLSFFVLPSKTKPTSQSSSLSLSTSYPNVWRCVGSQLCRAFAVVNFIMLSTVMCVCVWVSVFQLHKNVIHLKSSINVRCFLFLHRRRRSSIAFTITCHNFARCTTTRMLRVSQSTAASINAHTHPLTHSLIQSMQKKNIPKTNSIVMLLRHILFDISIWMNEWIEGNNEIGELAHKYKHYAYDEVWWSQTTNTQTNTIHANGGFI